MTLNGELVGFFYTEAVKNPMWAGQDTLDFMCETLRKATEKGLINKYKKMELDIMIEYGEDLEASVAIIEELKKIAPDEFYARKNGNWGKAYDSIVSSIREQAKRSGDPRFPNWCLRLWEISLKAAKWTMEDTIDWINQRV